MNDLIFEGVSTRRLLDQIVRLRGWDPSTYAPRQEELDRCLREIWGEDLVPFYERYDELKKFKYDKAKKGWVD